jgi:hypothetical protein
MFILLILLSLANAIVCMGFIVAEFKDRKTPRKGRVIFEGFNIIYYIWFAAYVYFKLI